MSPHGKRGDKQDSLPMYVSNVRGAAAPGAVSDDLPPLLPSPPYASYHDSEAPTSSEIEEALRLIRQRRVQGRSSPGTRIHAHNSAGASADPYSRDRRMTNVSFREALASPLVQPNLTAVRASSSTGIGTVINDIKAPELSTLDPKAVIIFVDKREDYEQRILDLQSSSSAAIHMSSWKLTVKKTLIKTMYSLRMFKPYAPHASYAEITSMHVREAILEIAERERSKRYYGQDLAGAMSKLRMNMSIADPEARMVMLVAEFNKMLWNLGMDSYLEENPKSSIPIITEALRPTHLRAKVRADIERNDRLGKEF